MNPQHDGLTCPWGMSNFVNPPYDQTKLWVQKAVEEMNLGRHTVMLIPHRPQRRYWFDLIWSNASQVTVLQGGVKFKGYKVPLPITMCYVVFDPNRQKSLVKFLDSLDYNNTSKQCVTFA